MNKKANKTILLASTFFLTSLVASTQAYASDDYKLDEVLEDNLDSAKEDIANEDIVNEDITNEDIDNEAGSEDISKESSDEDILNKSHPISEIGEKLSEEGLDEDLTYEESDEIIYYDDRSIDEELGLSDQTTEDISREDDLNESLDEDESTEDNIEKSPDLSKVDALNLPSKEEADESSPKEHVIYDDTDVDDVFPSLDVNKEGVTLTGKGNFVKKKDRVSYYEDHKRIVNASLISNDKFYTIDGEGRVANPKNEWLNLDGKTYFTNIKGELYKGFNKIHDKTYYFNDDGSLNTDTEIIKDDTYYESNDEGELIKSANKWIKKDGKILRTDSQGKILKGVNEINNNTYLFDDETGAMTVSEDVIKYGKFYTVDKRGVATNPKNSWVKLNGNTYHTNENGYVKEGVWKIGEDYYYFTKDGLGANTKVSQQGVEYVVDENGLAKPVDNKIAGEKSLDKMIEWMYTAMATGMEYSMDWRERVSDSYADCSSAVYRSMIYGGFLENGSAIGNTDTLFAMGAEGEVIYEIDESDIRYGDIFVAGHPGGSTGAAGHTGFILNRAEDTIISMNYTDNGVGISPRKGYMGDGQGLPVKYFRLVGGSSEKF